MASPVQLGLWVASALLSALLNPRRSNKGRADVGDVRVHGPTVGSPVPLLWGQRAVMGRCTWHGPFTPVEEGKKGGKGGGGKKGGDGQTTYRVSWMDALVCTGGRPARLTRIWRNDDLLWEGLADETGITTVRNPGQLDFTWHAGRLDQAPDARMAQRQGGLLGQPPGTGSSVAPTIHTEQHVLQGAAPTITVAHAPLVEGSDSVFAGATRVFARVASSPGQDEYTADATTGQLVFGGTYSALLVTVRYQTPSVYDQQEALGYPGIAYIYHHERNVGPVQSIEPLSYEVCVVPEPAVPPPVSPHAVRMRLHAPSTLSEWTADHGATWTSFGAGLGHAATTYWADSDGTIWTINPDTNRLRRSADGGQAWEDVGTAAPVSIAYAPSAQFYALARTGTGRFIAAAATASGARRVCVTDDVGTTWAVRTITTASGSDGVAKHGLWVQAGPPAQVYAVLFDRGVYRSSDDGETWTQVLPLGSEAPPFTLNPGWVLALFITAAGTLLAVHGYQNATGQHQGAVLKRSTDGGNTWTTVFAQTFFNTRFWDANARRYRTRLAQAPTGRITFMAHYYSDDDGVTWTATPSPPESPSGTGGGMGQTAQYVWWGGADNQSLYRSADGLVWQDTGEDGSIEGLWPVVSQWAPVVCPDVNPIDIATDILRDDLVGVGSQLPLHAEITAATRAYLQDHDLLVSVLIEQPTTALQALHDLMSHYLGWAGMLGEEFALGVHRPEPVTRELVVEDAVQGGEPVMALGGERDLRNRLMITFTSRARRYNDEPYLVPLGRDALLHGVRQEHVILPYYTRRGPVQRIGLVLLAVRGVPRTTQEITLGPKDLAVRGGDMVALTVRRHGIVTQPYRVMAVGIDETATRVRALLQYEPAASLALHTHPLQPALVPPAPSAPTVDAGPTVVQVWEQPPEVSGVDVVRTMILVAGTGHPDWVGARLYLSLDGGTSYTPVATYIGPSAALGAARGALRAVPGWHSDDQLLVDLTASVGTLQGTARNAALARATLALLGGEPVAYRDADLEGPSRYILRGVRRAVYGHNQPPRPVAPGDAFAFVGALPDFPVLEHPHDRIGQALAIKAASLNRFGVEQPLEDVVPVPLMLEGLARMPSPVYGLQVERDGLPWGSRTRIGTGEIDVRVIWRHARRDNVEDLELVHGTPLSGKAPDWLDYRVRVFTAATEGGPYGLRRTVYVTTEGAAYTAAMNIADNGTYHPYIRVGVASRRANGVLSRERTLDIVVVS